jgi:hypothetical protein
MTARIAPAPAPYAPDIQAWLDRTMPPGQPPLVLFTTLARDPRLFTKFFSAGLLDRGHLTLRQREIVIHRTHRALPLRVRMGRACCAVRREGRIRRSPAALARVGRCRRPGLG